MLIQRIFGFSAAGETVEIPRGRSDAKTNDAERSDNLRNIW
jgi:hypothetical protein